MKRHALFVGVDQYVDPTIQNLNFPSEDANELASAFKLLLKFDRVEKLLNPAHSADVVDVVKDMTRGLGPGDLFLFFFAGHGFRVKENHILVCAKDEYADLKDEYAGLAVGQLKKRMRGAWDRMLILDACQNDIRATRGVDTGATARDLSLIHELDAEPVAGCGSQILVTSCSEGQKALEVSELKHGLFTYAILDSITSFANDHRRIDIEGLRTDIGVRMGGLITKYRLSGQQEPLFTMPANAAGILLLDGFAAPTAHLPEGGATSSGGRYGTATPVYVVCPVCGKKNRVEDTFKCRECGCDNLCLRHQNEQTYLCEECMEKKEKNDDKDEAQDDYTSTVPHDDIPNKDIVFDCPHCGHGLVIDQRGAGLVINCTMCGSPVIVPSMEENKAKISASVEPTFAETPQDFLQNVVDDFNSNINQLDDNALARSLKSLCEDFHKRYSFSDQAPLIVETLTSWNPLSFAKDTNMVFGGGIDAKVTFESQHKFYALTFPKNMRYMRIRLFSWEDQALCQAPIFDESFSLPKDRYDLIHLRLKPLFLSVKPTFNLVNLSNH